MSINASGAIASLKRMIQFDSRTETPGEGSLATWLVEEMDSLGMETHLQAVGRGRYNAIGTYRGTGSAPSLLFNGHMDTNPLGEGWTVDPWAGDIIDGHIYGLGVSNMKAGCASYLEAFRGLRSSGFAPTGDVTLTFVVGELQGGLGTRALIADGYRADYFVNCEPTGLTALTMHAGDLSFSVHLQGATRHLSRREDAGDAVAAAAVLVGLINEMKFECDGAEDVRATNRAHVGVMRGALSQDFLETRPPLVGDVAYLRGSLRYGPGQERASVLRELQELVDAVAARHSVQANVVCPAFPDALQLSTPFWNAPESPIVRAVNSAYSAVRGEIQATGAIPPYCFFGSDASLLKADAGMDGVVCGPGGEFNTMPDERVSVDEYLDAVRMMRLVIERVTSEGFPTA